jgi:deoxyhypusine synthase
LRTNINQVNIKEDPILKELVNNLAETAFNAKRLAMACKIYEKMVKTEGCVKFFSLAGAMVPAGMQKIIRDMLEFDFIDVLITTGANVTHDVAETLGFPHLQGNTEQRDEDLFDRKINRIYDVFMPNEVYESMEAFIKTLNFVSTISVKEFLWNLGEKLPDHPHSILKICARKKIPIYCPAFTDCGLAMQVLFAFPETNLNQFQDLQDMINTAWDAKISGGCIVGGGVPKNYLMQAMQFSPNSLRFAIQITMDRPESGGLSGAELHEAISWGKINKGAEYSTVIADATIVLPILLSYLKTTCKT